MDYELGSIQVTAELQNGEAQEIRSLSEVSRKYDSLRERPKEHFYAIFLKSDDEVIGLEGTGDTPAGVKDIARIAILTNPGAVILVHNHPSGNAGATDCDSEVTQHAHDVLEKINVQLLDHVIITRDSNYSIRRKNDGPF